MPLKWQAALWLDQGRDSLVTDEVFQDTWLFDPEVLFLEDSLEMAGHLVTEGERLFTVTVSQDYCSSSQQSYPWEIVFKW